MRPLTEYPSRRRPQRGLRSPDLQLQDVHRGAEALVGSHLDGAGLLGVAGDDEAVAAAFKALDDVVVGAAAAAVEHQIGFDELLVAVLVGELDALIGDFLHLDGAVGAHAGLLHAGQQSHALAHAGVLADVVAHLQNVHLSAPLAGEEVAALAADGAAADDDDLLALDLVGVGVGVQGMLGVFDALDGGHEGVSAHGADDIVGVHGLDALLGGLGVQQDLHAGILAAGDHAVAEAEQRRPSPPE